MASGGNFALWNRLANVNPSLSYSAFILDKGNTRFRGNSGGTGSMTSTMSMTSGKWYIEFYVENGPAGGWPTLGLVQTRFISALQNVSNYQATLGGSYGDPAYNSEVVGTNGNIRKWDTTSSVSCGSAWSSGDIVQIAYDGDSGKWWFGKNNTWYASGNPATGANPIDSITAGTELSVWVASYSGSSYLHINSGQDDTFNGNVTAAGNADENGYGVFKYSPPSGYLALCSGNMSISSDIDPAQTDDDYPSKQFGAFLYTGNSGSAVTVSTDFQPDLIWIKNRSAGDNHFLQDSSRGFGNSKSISTNSTGYQAYNGGAPASSGAQNVGANSFQAYGTDWTYSTNSYVAWCWRANGGVTASNSDGSITTTVQANTAAGFSIITYTGTGANATIGHGLSKAPTFVICKNLADTDYWGILHIGSGFGDATDYLTTPSTGGFNDNATFWQDTSPSSSVITLGSQNRVNGSSNSMVCYAWHEVEGYSKFGGYTGGGNVDGPFIYTGFRPRMIFIKRTNSTGSWECRDTARDTYNPLDSSLVWEGNGAESSSTASSGYPLDVVANGFKIRTTNSNYNTSNSSYVYGCWADVPFKYNNTF